MEWISRDFLFNILEVEVTRTISRNSFLRKKFTNIQTASPMNRNPTRKTSPFFSPTSSCCWRRVPGNQSQLPVEQLSSDGNGDAKNECGSWNVKALVRKFNLLNNSSGSQRRHHPQPDYVMRLIETILFAKFGHQWRTH